MQKNPYKFHSEKPSSDDLYDGRSHEKVADALLNFVTDKELQQHIIGVEGDLGSGKSSVIEIFKNKLNIIDENNTNYIYWVFDCERYHHSSVKKNFIELISEKLLSIDTLDDCDKENIISVTNTALGKKLDYNKEITRNPSPLTLIFGASCGMSFLSYTALNSSILSQKFNEYLFNLNLFLLFLPIFCLVIAFIKYRYDDNWEINQIFKGSSNERIVEDISITKDVGITELKLAFKRFIRIARRKNENIRLILILDNLDRIQPEKVCEVWSDLEIYTECDENDNLIIILPFCIDQVASALSYGLKNTNDNYNSREFITKRVPITLRVPPILTAGWQQQFHSFWKYTFKDYCNNEVDFCIRLLTLFNPSGTVITPRLQKRFINDIASTLLVLPSIKISPCIIAFYILTCRYRNNSIHNILSLNTQHTDKDINIIINEFSKSNILNRESSLNWQTQLMCIHYQSEPKYAQSELLDSPIKDAIDSLRLDNFINLSDIYGFDKSLKRIYQNHTEVDIHNLAVILSLLTETKESEKINLIISLGVTLLNDMLYKDKNSITDIIKPLDYYQAIIKINKLTNKIEKHNFDEKYRESIRLTQLNCKLYNPSELKNLLPILNNYAQIYNENPFDKITIDKKCLLEFFIPLDWEQYSNLNYSDLNVAPRLVADVFNELILSDLSEELILNHLVILLKKSTIDKECYNLIRSDYVYKNSVSATTLSATIESTIRHGTYFDSYQKNFFIKLLFSFQIVPYFPQNHFFSSENNKQESKVILIAYLIKEKKWSVLSSIKNIKIDSENIIKLSYLIMCFFDKDNISEIIQTDEEIDILTNVIVELVRSNKLLPTSIKKIENLIKPHPDKFDKIRVII